MKQHGALKSAGQPNDHAQTHVRTSIKTSLARLVTGHTAQPLANCSSEQCIRHGRALVILAQIVRLLAWGLTSVRDDAFVEHLVFLPALLGLGLYVAYRP